jgi:putative ABC transport system permease protein
MWLTALRGILAHKLRLAATATAVLLGVALMSGTLVFTDTVTRTFDDLFGDVYAGTDVVVRGESAFDAPDNLGAQRDRVDASLVSTVAAVPGVAAAEGSVTGYARLVDKSGDAMGNPANGAPTIGYGWPHHDALNPFHLVAGTAPTAADEVVIDAKSAREAHFTVGDTVTVLTRGPARQFHLVGIVKFGTADSPGGATVAGFTLATAQNLIAQPGRYDAISVVATDGTSADELAERIAAVLPAKVEAVTGATATAETTDQMHKALGFFTTFMLVFAGVSLLVGGFMIFNTFAITVAQRTREHGLLRALGARRRQLLGAVLAEALLVGLVAAALGTALGLIVARGLQSLLNALGMEIPTAPLVFQPRTAVVSMLVGVGVTVVAALIPARRASRVPPMSALRAVEASSPEASLPRLAAGLTLAGGGVAALLLGLYDDVSHRVAVVGAGVLGLFVGITVLGPAFARPLSRALGWPVARLRGVAGAIARENAMRNPRRTAATAAALMIGVGLVGFITVFVSSAKTSVDHVVRDAFSGDLVIDSGASQGGGGIDPAVAAQVRALPEVAAVTGIRLGFGQVDGRAVGLPAIDPNDGFRILDVGVLAGSPADLGADAIAVQEDEARSHHWSVGDSVPVRFATGATSLRVAMIYRETNPLGTYVLGTPAFQAHFADQVDWEVLVQKAPGVSPDALRAAVTGVTHATPGLDVLTAEEYVDHVTAPMDQLLALVYALLSLAILIALLGIANTLALSIHERVHEIGLLRAVGMTRRQLRTSIRWESAIVSLQGTILGLGIGIFLGWALVEALSDQGITTFDIPWGTMAVIAAAAIVAGVVAGLGPARRAARLDVLRAVASH